MLLTVVIWYRIGFLMGLELALVPCRVAIFAPGCLSNSYGCCSAIWLWYHWDRIRFEFRSGVVELGSAYLGYVKLGREASGTWRLGPCAGNYWFSGVLGTPKTLCCCSVVTDRTGQRSIKEPASTGFKLIPMQHNKTVQSIDIDFVGMEGHYYGVLLLVFFEVIDWSHAKYKCMLHFSNLEQVQVVLPLHMWKFVGLLQEISMKYIHVCICKMTKLRTVHKVCILLAGSLCLPHSECLLPPFWVVFSIHAL